jgi:hypothetical protein
MWLFVQIREVKLPHLGQSCVMAGDFLNFRLGQAACHRDFTFKVLDTWEKACFTSKYVLCASCSCSGPNSSKDLPVITSDS